MKPGSLAALVALIVISAGAESATPVWRWTDGAGHVNYGAQSPPGAHAVLIEGVQANPPADSSTDGQAQGAASTGDAIKRKLDELREDRVQREKKQIEQQKGRQAAQQTAKACKQMQANLEALTSRGRASVLEGDQYRALPEEERQSRIREAHEFLNSNCKSGPIDR